MIYSLGIISKVRSKQFWSKYTGTASLKSGAHFDAGLEI